MEEPREHVDTPRLDFGHRRVLLDVDKVDRRNLHDFKDQQDENRNFPAHNVREAQGAIRTHGVHEFDCLVFHVGRDKAVGSDAL